ncbi:unnamed protein product [Oncorhynchus mykiss]|uniref:Immunoglobulin domain-containing protein n=1 Tax=Oncorhynchus mykiss TaxID=8022 RepID=A0A060Y7G8_ONCMY|nr:unnamed protein product [Oncorhynchus mykiss]
MIGLTSSTLENNLWFQQRTLKQATATQAGQQPNHHHKFETMLRVVGHLLCLFICCRGADGLTETLVELGQNTTINCSLNIESAYWYIQHQPQPPLAILRSFTSRSPDAFYYNKNYRQKYSLETGHRLLIQNVTVDDCGVFYCAKKEDQSLLFSNGTRLMTTVF